MSEEAKKAKSAVELWGLFITDKIVDLIVAYTNDKIEEDLVKQNYSRERISSSPYLKKTDKVNLFVRIIKSS